MQDLINQITSTLNIDNNAAEQATGGIFNIIKDQIGDGDFSELSSKIPGVGDVISKFTNSQEEGSGSALGGLAGMASNLVGGKLGSALGVISVVKNLGINTEQFGSIASLASNFISNQAGEGVLNTILEKAPEFKNLINK